MNSGITSRYLGDYQVELEDDWSGNTLMKFGPRASLGEFPCFLPTDLLAASLACCILTTIALLAERRGLNVKGMFARVRKHIHKGFIKITSLTVEIHLPAVTPQDDRVVLEQAARHSVVRKSLSREISIGLRFLYDGCLPDKSLPSCVLV